MVKLEIVTDFVRQISRALGIPEGKVEDYLEVDEDKQGWFYAKKHAKKWLETTEFKAMCALARDLGGDYVKEKQTWRVPSDYVKKQQAPQFPSEVQAIGVTPHVVSMDKSKPPELKPADASPIEVKPGYYEKFPIASIVSPKFTLRLNIEDEIQELIEQIGTTTASGEWCYIVQPLVCRPAKKPGYIEVCAGERRLYAARKLGLGVVPVVVKDLSDEEFDRIRLMENVARKDLTDYETARYIKHLMNTYPQAYPTQAQVADIFGKSIGWVSRHLAMLELEKFAPGQIEVGRITEKQARELLAAPPEEREKILKEIAETGEVPSSREIRRAVQPEMEHEPTTGFPPMPREPTTAGPPELKPIEVPEPKPEPLLTGFEVECPECHKKILINHKEYPNGKIKHEVED